MINKTKTESPGMFLIPDLVHLLKWTFDRKRILTLKHKNIFGETKWRHFSGKYTDTLNSSSV